MLTVFVHQSDTHTHIDNQLAVLCVCASGRRGEEEGNMTVLSCGGGVTFFSPGVYFFFFSLLGTCNFTSYNQREPRPQHTTLLIGYSPEALPQHTTLLDTVLRPLPFRLTTPQWIQSRGPPPPDQPVKPGQTPETVHWGLRCSLTSFFSSTSLTLPPPPSSVQPVTLVLSAFILKGSASVQLQIFTF